ncbi:MAG: toll/interleukin-1 receptor domain-containing protein [Bacilli bacterium]|nr:toll/interleukin-1 receptor domain-containing protein [Bacilli bacterium]
MYYRLLTEQQKALYDQLMTNPELHGTLIVNDFSIDSSIFSNDYELFKKILRYLSFDHPELGISLNACRNEDGRFKTKVYPVMANRIFMPPEEALKDMSCSDKVNMVSSYFDSTFRAEAGDGDGVDTASFVLGEDAGNSLAIALGAKYIFDRFGVESYIITGKIKESGVEMAWNFTNIDGDFYHFNAFLAKNGRWQFIPFSKFYSISDESALLFGKTISCTKSFPDREESIVVPSGKLAGNGVMEEHSISKTKSVSECRIGHQMPIFTDLELSEFETEVSDSEDDEIPIDSYVDFDDDTDSVSSISHDDLFGPSSSPKKQECLIDKVGYAVVSDKKVEKGDVCYINFAMFDEANRSVLDEIKEEYETPNVTISGNHSVERGVDILVILTSPYIKDLYLEETFKWQGGRSVIQFYFDVPKDYDKKAVILNFEVYANGLKLSKLLSRVLIGGGENEGCPVSRQDVKEAFISYSSKDRYEVSLLVQGMSSIYKNVHVFWDVESLRSGDDWQKKIDEAIEKADVLYLCWSENAAKSENVKYEWQTGIRLHSVDFIVPIPLVAPNPELCPIPNELNKKHFNDMTVYIRHYLKKAAM